MLDSLGYVFVAKWRLSDPSVQNFFDSLGYVLLPKSRLSSTHVELFDDSVGYFLAPKARLWRLPGAIHLKKLFDLLQIDCVLDVGANLGQYRDLLRKDVGFRGHIVSFEPIPSHVEAMRQRAKVDENWLIQGFALGASVREAPFNVMKGSELSSFLSPDDSVVASSLPGNEVDAQIPVHVKTLDVVFPDIEQRLGCGSVFLKLDTQGYDLEVLKGALSVLGVVKAVQIEVSVTPIYKGMPHYTTAISTLEDLGFELSGIFPNNSGHFPRLIEFDAVMIRKT